MTQELLRTIFGEMLTLSLKLSLPMLTAGLGVGLAVSLLQAVTQVQEMTLTFVPKVVAVVTILMVAGPWMADATMTFTREIYAYIPQMTAGG